MDAIYAGIPLPADVQREIDAVTGQIEELRAKRAALRRQLEEYPDIDAGLSRSERQLCEALSPGAITLGKLFAAHQGTESWVWLGDLSFAWYAERLSDCAHPIVVHPNGSRVIAPLRDTDGRAF